jgi:hypothetical protein
MQRLRQAPTYTTREDVCRMRNDVSVTQQGWGSNVRPQGHALVQRFCGAAAAKKQQNQARQSYIGFGDPLLDGEPEKFKDDGPAAKSSSQVRSAPRREAELQSSRP